MASTSRAATNAYRTITVLLALTLVSGLYRAVSTALALIRGTLVLGVGTSAVEEIELPAGFEQAGPTPIRYLIEDPSAAQFALATAPVMVWWAGVVTMLWLLRRIARSAVKGWPFLPLNVRRLRRLGLLLAVGYPLAVIVEGLLTNGLFTAGIWPEGNAFPLITIEFPVVSATALLGAASLFVAAEAFGEGVRLREDVDATV